MSLKPDPPTAAVPALARILVVDDEAPQMRALCETLSDHEYETHGCTSPHAALATLRKQKFDLLLTDLMMPGMDGISLLRAAHETDPDLVGILMTGHGTIDTAIAAMKSGALDYILKPFKLSVILPVLTRALNVRQLRRENAALDARVRERSAELEAANRDLDAFASSVAHDLHAPTRHVNGYAQILLQRYAAELSPEAQGHLRVIADAAERMGHLIADLLAFSRLARAEMQRQPVALDALVARLRHELKFETENREIVWEVAPLPVVPADESMLRQVLVNLLSNAIKYTRGRTPAVIEVGSRPGEPGETICFVRDNGAGFDMRFVGKLFGMFERLHRADEFEGTGIGLANVRRIIQRHGGRTWAEGEVGKGATFFFSLPDAKAD